MNKSSLFQLRFLIQRLINSIRLTNRFVRQSSSATRRRKGPFDPVHHRSVVAPTSTRFSTLNNLGTNLNNSNNPAKTNNVLSTPTTTLFDRTTATPTGSRRQVESVPSTVALGNQQLLAHPHYQKWLPNSIYSRPATLLSSHIYPTFRSTTTPTFRPGYSRTLPTKSHSGSSGRYSRFLQSNVRHTEEKRWNSTGFQSESAQPICSTCNIDLSND